MPFLGELATAAASHRDEFVWILGMLADERHAYGAAFTQVRAAVIAHLGLLAVLLDDADPRVREAAAYASTKAGTAVQPLWRRWAVEDDPAARASLALALGELDSAAATVVLRDAALHAGPQARVAAAVALLRAGLDWPAGTIPGLVAAVDDGAANAWAWTRGAEWPDEIVAAAPTQVGLDVVRHLLRSGNPNTRQSGLWALSARSDARRSAPAAFVPLVAPLLDDPDPGVRGSVIDVLRRAGAAAGQFADVLAEVAGGFPATAGKRGFTVEYRSIETLQRLGDPRWVEPVGDAVANDHQLRFIPGTVRFTPPVRAAIQARLVSHPADAKVLAVAIAHWGTDAAALVPAMLAAMPHAGPQIAATLLMLGCDEAAALPHWRTRATETGDLYAALAVRRLTGDIAVVLDALGAILVGEAPAPRTRMPDIGELGEALASLLPAAARYLTGRAERVHPQRDKQVLAARVTAAAAGPESALPTVEAVLVAGDSPARHAADFLADLAHTYPAAIAHLEPQLRDRLDDRRARLSAARALAQLGTPPAELAESLTQAITDHDGRSALAAILELRATETISALEELLGQDNRFRAGSSADDVVWADELRLEYIKDTLVRLRDY